jgi:cryptochrome
VPEDSESCRREFFYLIASSTVNFDQMEGNPICKRIDWDDNDEFYKAWDEARTGFPWIDAIMKQLHEQVLCAHLLSLLLHAALRH